MKAAQQLENQRELQMEARLAYMQLKSADENVKDEQPSDTAVAQDMTKMHNGSDISTAEITSSEAPPTDEDKDETETNTENLLLGYIAEMVTAVVEEATQTLPKHVAQ